MTMLPTIKPKVAFPSPLTPPLRVVVVAAVSKTAGDVVLIVDWDVVAVDVMLKEEVLLLLIDADSMAVTILSTSS